MQFRNYIIIIFFITSIPFSQTYSQEVKEKTTTIKGLIFGVNGFNYTTIETGYSCVISKYHFNKEKLINRKLLIFLEGSLELSFKKGFYFSPKISNKYFFEQTGIRGTPIGFVFGSDYIAYNDLKVFNYVVRPSIGFQLFEGTFEFSYGYNIHLDNNRELFLNKHNFQFILRPYIFKNLIDGAF